MYLPFFDILRKDVNLPQCTAHARSRRVSTSVQSVHWNDQHALLDLGVPLGGGAPTNVLPREDATRAPRGGNRVPSCGKFAPKDVTHALVGEMPGRPRRDRPRCRCPDTSARRT